jgi:hemolysin activation/secretion protein
MKPPIICATIGRRARRSAGWAAAILMTAHPLAWAQSIPPEPVLRGIAAPTQAERRNSDERREQVRSLPVTPGPSSAAGDKRAIITLSTIAIDGATQVPEAAIQSALTGFIGRPLSQADLIGATQTVTEVYRSAGFHLSRAVILPQNLRGNRIRISVVEGSIEEIVVKGDPAGNFGIAAMLTPISAERPSRRTTLERQLLLANDRPGIRVTDTALDEIAPGSGRFRLTVSVQSWTVYTAVGVDNHGSAAVGPWQASASAALNSIVVSGDSLNITGSAVPNASRELRFGRLSYDMPLGSDSFRIGASASRSTIWPGDQRRLARTHSQAVTYEIRAAYAPLLTKTQSLWFTGAVAISDVTEQNAFGRNYEDRLKIASLSADYKLNAVDGSWTYLSATYRQGLGLLDSQFDSRDRLSRRDASSHFSVASGTITHYQNWIENWSLKLAAAGQISSGPLLASQQYYLGGNWFGRGFAGGWISGDDAAAGSAELRFDQPANFAFAKGYQLYSFLEGGLTATRFEQKDLIQRIGSVGIGLRVFVNDDLQFGIAVAKPVAYRSPTYHDRGTSVLFSMTNAMRLCPRTDGLRC